MKSRVQSATEYFDHFEEWKAVGLKLDETLTRKGFDHRIRWGRPVYQLDGKNRIGISVHKHHMSVMFFQGAVLRDPNKLLINAQEGKTKAMRQLKVREPGDVNFSAIESLVDDVIECHKSGKEVKMQRGASKEFEIPEELRRLLDADTKLGDAFESLTPYKRKEYAEYISEAKRDSTRERRLNRIQPMIMQGKGLNDRYR